MAFNNWKMPRLETLAIRTNRNNSLHDLPDLPNLKNLALRKDGY